MPHNPGPWRCARTPSRLNITDAKGIDVAAVYNNAYAHAPEVRYSQIREASARLIAAAPDLLDALDSIATWAADVEGESAPVLAATLQDIRGAALAALGSVDRAIVEKSPAAPENFSAPPPEAV